MMYSSAVGTIKQCVTISILCLHEFNIKTSKYPRLGRVTLTIAFRAHQILTRVRRSTLTF